MSKLIRVNLETYALIESMQAALGNPSKQEVIRKALDQLNSELLMAQTDVAFKRLKKDKSSWKEELKEREEWGFLNEELKDE